MRAATFPPRYRIHKYWGKKPGNVVAAYIERFSEPGALVLDPFAGSGIASPSPSSPGAAASRWTSTPSPGSSRG